MNRTAQDYAADVSALAPIDIPASRRKLAGIAVVCFLCTAFSLWMLNDPDEPRMEAWLASGFFGFCTLVMVGLMLRPPTLHLDRNGFWHKGSRATSLEHSIDTDDFRMQRIARVTQLAFTLSREPRHKAEGAAMSLTGGRGAIPGEFILSGQELATLLQNCRDAAVRSHLRDG